MLCFPVLKIQDFEEVVYVDLSLISHIYFPKLENKWRKVQMFFSTLFSDVGFDF